ncbi:hypothetical protein AQ490_05225 [Wenjunlia vitaminophila]|uniref:YcaO domain-containing protein n=1 Tax=Wenjunlia vitaminophila TaxID=76728 RepID=A0A0T6LPE6_WENVI|nr:TOMM precursor leader peptide-binding protein [Wenjunlia vitaminophila]KRV47777.1 hypothetical protein AQ490_05225 [Wenjunlia vitaminophila]
MTTPADDRPPGGELLGFKRHLRAEVVRGEATYLFSERNVSVIRGVELEELAPLLDGTRDLAALADQTPWATGVSDIEGLTDRLARVGLLQRRPAGAEPDRRAEAAEVYWGLAGLDGVAAHARTTAGRVRVVAVGAVDTAEVAALLAASGVEVLVEPDEAVVGQSPTDHTATPDHGPTAGTAASDAHGCRPAADVGAADVGAADLTVVLCEDYLSDELAAVDAAHRASGRPWLLAKPVGADLWVGPAFRAGGPCWHCLAHRLRGHRQAEGHVQRALGRSGPVPRPVGGLAALDGLGARLVALEAVKWLAGHRHPAQQGVWVLDSLSLESRTHPLRARPQCSACGDPSLVAEATSRPVVINSRPKVAMLSGDHRALRPEQMLAAYGHLVSPVTGVVKAIEPDRRGPGHLNVFRSGPNVATGDEDLAEISAGLRRENGGKGVTAVHARVSALCEALERHCGHFQGDELRVRASYRSLGDAAVHPDACQLYHERQFADRHAWNARHGSSHRVVEPFDEEAEIDWTPLWSLTERRQRMLPTSMLYYRAPAASGRRFTFADSNGNASGSSLEDAVVHGFLELVERDAAALWWYNRTIQPALDLDAFGDPWVEETRQVYADLDRELWALDLTSDLGIPTVVAVSRRPTGYQDIVFGFGAHFDPLIALRRAVGELNQMLPFVVDAKPDGTGYGSRSPELLRWWTGATVEDQPYVGPDPQAPARAPWDFSFVPRCDLRDDVEAIESLVRAHGLELLVLDQTRADIGLPVVKVVVPGLRHFRARFAPGRLYDAPVRLGRLASPRAYEELNPVPMFV